MARVKGPLLSVDATGQLGKALIFAKWKGLKTVRGYYFPRKSASVPQVAQRSLFKAVATEWKGGNMGAEDKKAWGRFGRTLRKKRPSYNAFTKHYLQVKEAGQEFLVMRYEGYIIGDEE